MDILTLSTTAIAILLILTSLFLKRKSIKAYFAKISANIDAYFAKIAANIEAKKELVRMRHQFVESMNKTVNPFTGYQMISYKSNGRKNNKAVMFYNIPLEDLHSTNKWEKYIQKEMNQFIDTLKSHDFKSLEVKDCNGGKRKMKLK